MCVGRDCRVGFRSPASLVAQEMMVSCKAGLGCGEMCVTGELMHVHADEQAMYA